MINIINELENELHIIRIEGDVDASSSIYLDKAISTAIENGQRNIIIDCSNLDYISSAGLGVFMSYIQDFEESNSRFVLFGLNKKVASVFEILGLDRLLTIVSDRQEARQSVQNEI